jgi:hypothetical protein
MAAITRALDRRQRIGQARLCFPRPACAEVSFGATQQFGRWAAHA